MFTPPRKLWSAWSTPKSGEKGGSGNPSGSVSGYVEKSLLNGTVSEPMTPSLDSNKGGQLLVGDERLEGAPAEVVAILEKELLEYQYNMGLLLIEKQEWSSKLEEMSHALGEAKDALKREQSAYFPAITDFEKREENLRKALGVEKQCVHDLEQALHQMRSEYAEIKFTSDSKLAEANALVSRVEEKSLEVEAKLHAADARLAEVSRKSEEIERKLLKADAREDALRKEYTNFSNEREANEHNLSKRREDLQEWESKLQAGEERLSEGRVILNRREERANEKDKLLKQKELDLIETQKRFDGAKAALKAEEEDIMQRLLDLSSKEKELDAARQGLEIKEKDLLASEEKLNHREKVQIQELTDEHSRLLETKKIEFELEIEQKRQSIDEELKNKIAEVEKKEASVNHAEEKLAKIEQGLERRLEKLREKEKEHEAKVKALKDKEKSLRLEEKHVEKERVELFAYKDQLQSEKDELEQSKADVQEQQVKLCEQIEKLNVTEEERSEFVRLQAELKREIYQCRSHKELVLKDSEDLRQQREIFERDWEELDKKKSEFEAEIINLSDQKEKIKKLQNSEEEKLRKEKLANEEYIRRELAALEFAKGSHAASMEHDTLAEMERIKNERSQMLRNFKLQQQEIENDMQRRQEELETQLREKEKLFEAKKEKEEKNLNYLREVTNQEMEAMKLERIKLDKEKQEVSENQKYLESNQLELRRDIDELVSLSRKLKIHREQFIRERERFVGFVEKHRSCEKCGEITSEFVLSDLQVVPEKLSDSELADRYLKDSHETFTRKANVIGTPVAVSGSPASGATVSWLRKCTSKILRLSPIKIVEPVAENPEEASTSANRGNTSESLKMVGMETALEASNNFAKQNIDVEGVEDDPRTKLTEQVLPESSQHSAQKGAGKAGKRRKPILSRTRSVKAVVEDAKKFIGEDFENCGKNTQDSSFMISESRGESSLAKEIPSRSGRKRTRKVTSHISGTEVDDNDESEGHSNSLASRQRKRRQKAAPAVQIPTGNRYNLRRPRIAPSSAQPITENRNRGSENARDKGEDTMKLKDAPGSSFGSIRDDGRSSPNFQFETPINVVSEGKEDVVETTVLSEEVNRSAAQSMQNESGSETPRNSLADESSSSSDEDEDQSEHPGEASIGKKLWTFLTT
ncbi:hypothetical protein QQ045_023047 [Rhodiola kirilowii]